MSGINSFNKFNYWLRPSKQVERKILIEKLLRLSQHGYDIQNYTYLGFGSVYFVDFIMFHKYLFIEKMECVEHGSIPRRMRFNKPYKCIKLKLRAYSEVADRIRRNANYLVWLDYDYPLCREMLQDIDSTMQRLKRKSIFLVTIDGRAKLPSNHPHSHIVQSMDEVARQEFLVSHFGDMINDYLDHKKVTANSLDENAVPELFWEAVTCRIRETLELRDEGLQFVQLFNFRYADGCQMLTFGGIVGTKEDADALEASRFFDEPFISRRNASVEISVPPLTYTEKQWLDKRLKDGLTVNDLAFELEQEFLDNYCKFHKQYPTFVEAIV